MDILLSERWVIMLYHESAHSDNEPGTCFRGHFACVRINGIYFVWNLFIGDNVDIWRDKTRIVYHSKRKHHDVCDANGWKWKINKFRLLLDFSYFSNVFLMKRVLEWLKRFQSECWTRNVSFVNCNISIWMYLTPVNFSLSSVCGFPLTATIDDSF